MPQCDKCNHFCFDDGLCNNCQIKESERIEFENSNIKANQPGLGQLTDKYILEGESEDDAYRYACQDKGIQP
jgi:hypothetical protein